MVDLQQALTECLKEQQNQEEYADRHWIDDQWYFGVSAIGSCPRQAVWSITHKPITRPFSDYSLHAMHGGIVWEEDSYALWNLHPDIQGESHVPVHHGAWIGEIDYLLHDGTIVEHKNASIWSFKSDTALPRDKHLLQVTLYGWLRKQITGAFAWPDMYLYYRARNNYAQIEVRPPTAGQISYEGIKDGDEIGGTRDLAFDAERLLIERWHGTEEDPPRHEKPTEHNYHCMRQSRARYYPTCSYFQHCWPELAEADVDYFTKTSLTKYGIEV